MKFLVVVVVVALVGWLLLRSRGGARVAQRGAAPAQPQAMVQCLHCGVHLPRSDALEDPRGMFCSEAHRLAGPRPR